MSSNIPNVCIQKSKYENIDLNSLLKPLGGLENFVNKGENVLIKTNLLNATEPEKVVVTSPKIIGSVAKEVMRIGAKPIIGDSPSGPFTKRRLKKVYEKSGLIDLSNDLGIELNYDTSSKKIDIPDAVKLKKTKISNFIFKSDKIISIPKLKTHSYMIMSLALKIMYGAIPGLTKARYHSKYIRRKDFSDMLLDVLSVTTPNLVIMDGIIAMQGEGPTNGTPVELGLILASDDSVAIDISVCRILGIEPTGIPVLKQSKIRKLFPEKINYPLLKPDDIKHKDFVLPSSAGYLITGEKKPEKKPVVNNNCTACKECVMICPRKAIEIKEDKADVDYKKCIRCFCCHEVCTFNAINLK